MPENRLQEIRELLKRFAPLNRHINHFLRGEKWTLLQRIAGHMTAMRFFLF